MKKLKCGTYLAQIGKNMESFNVYICQSPDFYDFTVCFDADPFYGGVAFDFENFPSCKKFNDAVELANNKLNPTWI